VFGSSTGPGGEFVLDGGAAVVVNANPDGEGIVSIDTPDIDDRVGRVGAAGSTGIAIGAMPDEASSDVVGIEVSLVDEADSVGMACGTVNAGEASSEGMSEEGMAVGGAPRLDDEPCDVIAVPMSWEKAREPRRISASAPANETNNFIENHCEAYPPAAFSRFY